MRSLCEVDSLEILNSYILFNLFIKIIKTLLYILII